VKVDAKVAAVSVLMNLGRHVGFATLAGMIAGAIVGGVGGRIAMRVTGFVAGPSVAGVTTTNGNRVGEITLGGTIGVLLVGVALGVLGGLVYAVVEPWLRRLRPWQGVAFGVFLLVAAGIAVLDPVNSDFSRFGSAPLNVAMFGALFLLFGILIAWVFDRLPAIAAQSATRARFVVGLGWLALLLAAAVLLLSASGLGTSADALPTLVTVGSLSVAALAFWRRVTALGYAALGVLLLTGAVRLVSALPVLLEGL
jgi:hypothetical protein